MTSITCQQLLLAVVVLLGAIVTCHSHITIKSPTDVISSYVTDNQGHINSVHPTAVFSISMRVCGQSRSATTLHGVYMTVLLVLVAVTITMTTLVVYMCLMMRRAKSGRVPQTNTGTTHTNNMAASDYCEPISLRYMQTTGTGNVHMRTGNSCSDRVPDNANTSTTTGTSHNNTAISDYCEPISLRYVTTGIENDGTVEPATQETTLKQDHTYGHLNHHTHPPIFDPPTRDNTVYSELTNTYKTTPQGGGYKYEIVDEAILPAK